MRMVVEAMDRSLVSVPAGATLAQAAALVRDTGAEHVLVLDEEHLVGILCACDLRDARGDEPVLERMSAPSVTVRPEAPVEAAARAMEARGVGCLPVTVGGLILGTLSERELARAGVNEPRARCRQAHRRHPRPNEP